MSRNTTLVAGWALAMMGMVLFAGLGQWQLHRSKQKQAMLQASASVIQQRRSIDPSQLSSVANGAYAWLAVTGHFISAPRLLLDNQMHQGQPGVRVYCLFAFAEPGLGHILVDTGWLPINGQRQLPVAGCPVGEQAMQGLLTAPPAAGFRLGSGQIKTDAGTWLATRIDLNQAKTIWPEVNKLAAHIVKLDPKLPIGYPRDLDILPNTLTPERHLGYAVQWFGLALTVLITALVLTFRGRLRR